MRTKSATDTALCIVPHTARTTVQVYRVDPVASPYTLDEVVKVEVNEDLDSPRSLVFTALRGHDLYSLAPMQTAASNPYNATEVRVAVGRRVVVKTQLLAADGGVLGTELTIFDGYIDEVRWPDDLMEVVATDKSGRLRDTWIERERIYGLAQGANATKGCYVWREDEPNAYVVDDLVVPSDSQANFHYYKVTAASSPQGTTEPAWPTGSGATVVSGGVTFTEAGGTSLTLGVPVQTLMQQVLNDNGLGNFATVQVPVAPSWNVRPYLQGRQTVKDALEAMADQMGWMVRFVWDSALGKYEVTLFEPNRAGTTALRTFNTSTEVRKFTEASSRAFDIRNVVRVVYSDASDLTPTGRPKRKFVDRIDSASVTKYGRRFMEVAESSASNIDTTIEATRMADAILSDLAEPLVGVGLTVAVDPFLELNDLLAFTADGLHWSSTQTLAVSKLTHLFSAELCTTALTLRGKPASREQVWGALDARWRPGDVHQFSHINSTGLSVTAGSVIGGTQISVAPGYLKATRPPQFEFHVSDSGAAFIPTSATLVQAGESTQAQVTNLLPGRNYFARVVPFARNGEKLVRGSPSAAVAFTAGRAKAGHYDSLSTQSHLPLNGNFEHSSGDWFSTAPDHWSVESQAGESGDVWGGSVYFDTDTIKGRMVTLEPDASHRGRIISSPFEVRRGCRALNIYLSIRRQLSSAVSGKDLLLDVLGYADSGLSVQIINYTVTFSGDSGGPYPALNTWYDVAVDFGGGYGALPTNVNYMRLVLRRGTAGDATFRWDIGDVFVQEADFFRATVDQLTVNTAAWTAASFENSFSDYNVASYQPTGFLKDSLGFVHLRGLFKRATAALSTNVFTLPAGYRPAKNVNFLAMANGRDARVEVDTSGQVRVLSATDASWFSFVSLEGFTFDTR